MKTGIAYKVGPRAWATVEMVHKWRKVVFISGKYKKRFCLVFGENDPQTIAMKAYQYLDT